MTTRQNRLKQVLCIFLAVAMLLALPLPAGATDGTDGSVTVEAGQPTQDGGQPAEEAPTDSESTPITQETEAPEATDAPPPTTPPDAAADDDSGDGWETEPPVGEEAPEGADGGEPPAATPADTGEAGAAPASEADASVVEDGQLDYVPGEVLLLFDAAAAGPQAEEAAEGLGGAVTQSIVMPDAGQLLQVALPDGQDAAQVAEDYGQLPGVLAAEPNYIIPREKGWEAPEELAAQVAGLDDEMPQETNDPDRNTQWYMDQLNLKPAWKAVEEAQQGSKVLVAVLDGGADARHPDLQGNLNLALSASFATGTKGRLTAYDNHATNVCGIIAAASNNGMYYAGVGTGAQNQAVEVMSVDVFGYHDETTVAIMVAALNYAVSCKASVVNMSLGGYGARSKVYEAAINAASAAGVVLVAAAGNENTDEPAWPSDFSAVISVIALNIDMQRSSFSNYGKAKFISAPGGETRGGGDSLSDYIWNTGLYDGRNNGAVGMAGTSQAAPQVAAVVAMMLYVHPGLSAARVRDLLAATADDIGSPGFDAVTGWGFLNAGAAVAAAAAHPRIAGIALSPDQQVLDAGSQTTITVTALPDGAATGGVSWHSSDTRVAIVDENGVVTGLDAGTATITATAIEGMTASCTVTVQAVVRQLRVPQKTFYVVKGKTLTVPVAVTVQGGPKPTVEWSSADTAIATVDAGGKVRAVGKGKTTLTAAAGGQSVQFTVQVLGKKTAVKKLKISGAKTVTVGSPKALTVKLEPAKATGAVVKWKSSNSKVVAVDAAGTLTAKKEGSVKITASVGKVKAYVTVKAVAPVKKIALEIQGAEAPKSMMMGANVYFICKATAQDSAGKAMAAKLTWKSSNKTVATVNSKGKVVTHATGRATITVKAGNGKKATVKITVI